MKSKRNEPELVELRRLSEELSSARKERVTTAHLLAAIASCPSPAADLLSDRDLSSERLLRAARATEDDDDDPVRRAIERAREVGARMGAADPLAVHLLIALLVNPRSAAYRALDQCGVDVNRLRVASMNVGLGLVGKRRIITRREDEQGMRGVPSARLVVAPGKESVRGATTAPRPSGTTVPLVSTVRSRSTPPPPEDAAAMPGRPEPQPSSPTSPRKRDRKPAAGSRFELDPKRFPALTSLGKNLTLEASLAETDPVVGREMEVEQALDILAKRQGNNPCFVGAAGVGKTSIVRAIARRIAAAEDVSSLDDRIIVEIPITELLAGTGVRGALGQRFGALRKEVLATSGRVVLFFDEVHQLFQGDAADEISGELKLALARGELPCLAATTTEEYRKYIESDAALARRFSVVEVAEPSREDAYLVLDSLSAGFERHHGVRYAEESLALAVGWSVRYLPGRALPDKAVSIVDLAGARARRRGVQEVTAEVVAEIVSEMTGVPEERLLETDRDRMMKLEELLADRVVGHGEAIAKIARILRRNAAGLGGKRPVGTFLLLGPTGVGKTETAKAIAEVLFFDENAMTRLDMSEYSEPHAVARLIGAPPGYVGHEAGGQLTESIRKRPYQVVLLDEIEKAHPDVLQTFLGVFDEGRLTDGRGRLVDFSNAVLFLTSNLGSEETAASARRRVGFGASEGSDGSAERAVVAAARGALSPELYNRLDEVLVFAPLTRDAVREIARRLLGGVADSLAALRGVELVWDDAVVEHLLDAGGFEPALGARPMKRAIARLVEAPLADSLLGDAIEAGSSAVLGLSGGSIAVEIVPPRESAAE